MKKILAGAINALPHLCLAVVGATAWAAAACPKVVITSDPEYPPLHWYNGTELRGASIKVVTRILESMSVPYELSYVGPFARVLATAQNGNKVDIVTTLKDTPERRAFLTYTAQPAFGNPVAVFMAREKAIHYSGWPDLRPLRGGIARGNRFGEPFDTYMQTNLNIEEANSAEVNFRKLAVGRIDYLITGYYAGLAYLAAQKQQDNFVALKPFVTESTNYIAFVSSSPCIQYLNEFNRRLAEFVKSGEAPRLIEEALQEWRRAPRLGQ